MTTKSSKSASGDDNPTPTPATLASQTDPTGPDRDTPGAAPEMTAAAVSAPLPGDWVLTHETNPDTNAPVNIPALVVLAGDPADDGSVTVDLWRFGLQTTSRVTAQLYENRAAAEASDRPLMFTAWPRPL